MPLAVIETRDMEKIGLGIARCEDVVVSKDGKVWASDQASACAEILPDGSLRRVGKAGGAPNGINMDAQGRIIIANFGVYEGEDGPLQRLDVDTGEIESLASEIDGQTLTACNYPIVAKDGTIYCTHSTWANPWPKALDGRTDGFVFRGATDYVGSSGGAVRSAAVTDLIDRARASDPGDPLYVIAIGAITNVASALMLAPDIAERVVVVWLGGHAPYWPHTREFNLRQDIPAAQHVLNCGVPLVLVPCLGVTSHLTSTVPEIEAHVEPNGRIGAFLAERFKGYTDDPFAFSKEIWDMAPVGWLIDPEWVPTVVIPAPILTTEATWSYDPERHPIRCATQVRRDPTPEELAATYPPGYRGDPDREAERRPGTD